MTVLGLALATAVVASPAAHAALDVDFGAAVRVNDDTDLYFAISSRYFDRDRRDVEYWGRRCDDPDDLAVALFIGRHSGRSLNEIFDLRRRGRTWWEISLRFGVPPDVWFVPVRRDPGPPYGKAYGHWKKHRRDDRRELVLSDFDVRNLVAVRVMHEYYGVSAEIAMRWRSDGDDLRSLASAQYRERHDKSRGNSQGQNEDQDHDHPGHGHGKKK
jgi:hypothetical protein